MQRETEDIPDENTMKKHQEAHSFIINELVFVSHQCCYSRSDATPFLCKQLQRLDSSHGQVDFQVKRDKIIGYRHIYWKSKVMFVYVLKETTKSTVISSFKGNNLRGEFQHTSASPQIQQSLSYKYTRHQLHSYKSLFVCKVRKKITVTNLTH